MYDNEVKDMKSDKSREKDIKSNGVGEYTAEDITVLKGLEAGPTKASNVYWRCKCAWIASSCL